MYLVTIAQKPNLTGTIGIVPLNDTTIATASISMPFLEKQAVFKDRNENSVQFGYCDYIDDYRSKTIFNVTGSVGGLFALLQSLQITLIGRSML